MDFKLTSSQLNFYTKNIVLDGSIWNQSVIQVFPKVYTYEQLNDAYNCLVRDNESLRVKFKETADGLVSYVEDFNHVKFPFIKVNSDEELLEETRKAVNLPIDFHGRLVNCIVFQTPTKSGIIICAHHIVIDGYCSFVMSEHINEYLRNPEYRPVTQPYADYIEKEEKHKQSKRFLSDREFWKNQFSTNPTCNIFSGQNAILDFSSEEIDKDIPTELLARVKAFCTANEISPASFFNTVYATYIRRIYDVEKFTIGVPVLNRTTKSELNTIGLYMHLVPLVVNIQSESFIENAKKIEDSWLNIFRHQRFTQYDIRQMLREENMPINTLYDVAADFLEFVPNNDYEIILPYGNNITIPLEFHLQSFNQEKCGLRVCYQTAYFTENEIKIMLDSVVTLMENAIEHPFENINDIEIVSVTEKQKLLKDFNDTKAEYPQDKSIHELFEEQVEITPDKVALMASDKTLTYRELNEEANKLANSLIEKGVKTGDIVGAKLSRTSKFLVAILGIVKAGAAYLPFDPAHPQGRIEQILSDSGAKLCITEENFGELLNNSKTKNSNVKISSDSICYCIYTSGSTGTPKGAMIQHKNLCWYMSALMNIYGTEPINMPFFTSPSVDLSVPSYFLPLMTGGTTYFYDNDLLSDLSEIINNQELNIIKVTPTHMQIILQHIKGRNLKNIKHLIFGGESLYRSACVDFLEKFGRHIQIHNEYGPTETTVSCVDYLFSYDDTDVAVPIGSPISNAQIYIVDKHTNLLPIGVTGELCIAGDGVCTGYLNNLELTAEKFIDNPFSDGKMYKTGDLAYWREDGNLVFVGRKDFQVKIRGLRIELGEIESVLQAVEGVEHAVVVVRKDKKGRQLICAFYTGTEIDVKELRTQLSATLPKYMVPHIFTHIEEMPLTASGKANRNALPEIDLDNISTETEYVAPQTFEEEILATATETVLDVEKVGVFDNFFDLGGDSLKSIELVSELEDKGYTVNIKAIFEAKDIQSLAKELTVKERKEEKVEYTAVLPATAAQMSVYTPQMVNANATLYNIPCIFKVEELDVNKLEDSINKLIARHEGLRTSFENRNGEIIQIINDAAVISIEELKNDNPEDFIRPFDLSTVPLLRVGYYENTVMVDMHHIIADGSTVAIFYRELNELYMGRKLPPTVQYGEFAVTSKYTEDDKQYWINEYKDIPVLELYTDYPKSEMQSAAGSRIYEHISLEMHNKIIDKCRDLNVTPYAYYMACYNILLSKYSGNEDICVGVPSSGRNSTYLNTWGMLVNMLSLRNQPIGTKDFKTFANEVRENSIEAISHQNYPQQELIKKTSSKKTLFDVMFIYQSEKMTKPILGDKKAELIPVYGNTSRCDLCFQLLPRENETVLMAEYCTDLYKEETIKKFIKAYMSILEQALNEETLIKDITALTNEERETILKEFNNTTVEYPQDKCIHELFEEQVERTPDKVALVATDKKVTYRELNEEANKIANALIEQGIGKGDIVGLMLPRKSYLLSALFGILKTGAAYLPIDSELPKERIEYMCQDTNAKIVVSEENIYSLMQSDNISNPKVDMTNESLCYCIYTSGSTGQPKGVMARHRNVVNYISKNEHNIFGKIIKEDFEAIVSISTCSFDIFVTETIATLVNGLRVVLADEQECRNQYALNRLLTRERGEFLQTTPTKLKALTREPSQREFLRDVKAILLGGEAMEVSYLKELKEITNAKIYNIYGVTEVPIWSTFADTDTFRDVVTVGKPIANTQVYIVDKYMNPVPMGVMGELCIAGESVSSGYLNRPELTAEKFIDNPFGEGKLYKTGDHAYWTEDGNLVFIGRKDFQVKIRGLRIELGEIESVLQNVDGVERAVVVVRKDKEDRQLICAFYTGEEFDAKALREELSKSLPKYMVPHIFTHLDKMPMTASGKANRNALPEIDLENINTETEYVAAETIEEKALTEAIGKILDVEKVGVLDNFFDLGGDSLKAIELVSELEDKGYTVNVKAIFEAKDIQSLAKELTVKTEKEEKIHYDSVTPATAAQMRIYTSQIVSPESLHYNIVAAFRTEKLDVERLEKAVNELVVRHEGLRTSFENRNGEIVQVINEPTAIKIEKLNSEEISQFNTAFELSTAPLFKVGYYDNTVMVVAHHIIVDGESMTVLCKELNELYMGRELKETVQYGEFAVTDSYTEENEQYWLNIFSEEVPEIELPTDYPRPEKQTFKGTQINEYIDIQTHNRIAEKCKQLNITPYVFYMGCYNILLSKFSGNEDICVGMPISGRTSKYLNTIGMFVNTVVLRTNTDGNKTIGELMQEIRVNSISAIDNQAYPFGELVKKLNKQNTNRNPLFDVMFAYQNEAIPVIIFGDKEAESVPVKLGGVKCDLNFNIFPTRDNVVIAAEYSTDLYKEETIKKFIKAYMNILAQALNEETLIKDISALTDEERETILNDFNNTAYTYDIEENTTLYSLFERASEENKDKVCIKVNEKEITYKEFKAYAERLDSKARSITKEEKTVIAVICERSFEMYGAVYGIIRGGNAYLPIDPNYPQDRIDYILENSNAKAVIAQEKFCHLVTSVPCINATEVLNSKEQPEKTECLANENDTAYVIYTSGSTGNPKGARISHKSAINRILWMHDFYPLEENDVILQKTPYTFDVSVWELFWWGITGRTLCASKPDEHFLPAKILEETEKHSVTHLHFVPSVFDLFLTYLENNPEEQGKFNTVKYVFLSGEALTANHINRFYNIYDYNKVSLHNLYGPTECAVDVSYYDCVPTDIDPVPIGKPIYNTQLHIVDKHLNPTPIGVVGELCIAGVNVGQGYLNNETLTNEKFIPNPFGTGKLYKTGDLAYWREDGNICYVGRNDFQVKINGQRIELGEIENAITEVDGVVQCAVIVREQHICAFYTGEEIETGTLRTVLNTKLPRYMVPHIFTHMEEMPMTVSGKLNRKALPEIDLTKISEGTEYVAPKTQKEKVLLNVLSTVLSVEKVNMLDNFFNIGGDSITAIYVVSELEEKGYELHVADIMQNDTLLDVANAMKSTSDKAIYDQSEVNGIIPFTPVMRAFLKEENTIPKDFVHTCVVSVDCDEDTVKKAIDILVSHHDMLRGTFTENGIKVLPSNEREVYSFKTISINDTEEATEYLRKTELEEDKLVNVVYCKTEKENLVSITVHHFLIDLVSWEVLMKDFNTVVNQIKTNEEINLPAKTASFKLWNEELTKYSETTENKEYWNNINEKLDNTATLSVNEENEAEEYSITLDENTSSKLINDVNSKYGTRTNEVLLTAVGLAAGKIAEGTVGIMVESHGRTELHKPIATERTVGWFTSCYPVVINNNENVAEELINVKEIMRRIPKNGIDYLLLSDGFHKKTDILFNFYKTNLAEEKREDQAVTFGGNSVFPGKINVNCFDIDNIITVNISVPKSQHKANIAAELGLEIQRQTEKIAGVCTETDTVIKTRSDFSDNELTESELEELKDLFDWGDDDE